MKILFTDTSRTKLEHPKPALKLIPEWYKDTESYINGEKKPTGDGLTAITIKRCMPVFDAMTAGYIIESPADVWVSTKDGNPYYEWSSLNLISFHPIEQAPLHPDRKSSAYPKWMNPWAIKTPNGYSTMFVQPFHRQSVFTILPGIVDTDRYTAPVNFPFVLNDPQFEGLIPVGTPIAQVIPFKRESWKIEIGKDENIQEYLTIDQKLRTKFFDRYKSMFWSKKEYK